MTHQDAPARTAKARRLAAEARALERRGRLLKAGAVAAALAILVAGGVVVGVHASQKGKLDASRVAAVTTSQTQVPYGLLVGDKNAPHALVVYEDLLCPYCDQFEVTGGTQLAQLAAQGKVYIDYQPFHFLPEAYSAQALNAFAAVLKTSGPQVAKKFHDLLYRNQPKEEGPFPQLSSLVDLAVQAGADRNTISPLILNSDSEKSWTTVANSLAHQAGVQGTPTIVLDGQQFQQGDTVPEITRNLIKALS